MSNSDTPTDVLPRNHVAVAIYNSPAEAKSAVKDLKRLGFDLQNLSIIDRRSQNSCDRWGHQCNGLYCIEIPETSVPRYEIALKSDKSILIAQWTGAEVACGSKEISRTHPESVDEY